MTFPSKSNRPKWSFETHFWAAVVIAAIANACVLLISKKNIWVELEIIVGVLSLICFAYFLFLFYYGIRFEKKETYSIVWKPFRFDGSWFDTLGMVDTGGLFTEAGAEAGPLGCVVGLLLDLVVSIILIIVIAFLLWFGINIVTTGIIVLLLPLYLLFRRSLRVAIARGRTCRGNLGKSLKFAFLVTITNMVWLYLIIFTGHHISRWLSKS
jgi:hypothetical protein